MPPRSASLWRALHVELDPAPHILDDEIGLALAAPDDGWQRRRDMNPRWTSRNRASIVGRARFVEDLVAEQAAAGTDQFVILGAGLDTFAQRHGELAGSLSVFEVDRPETQAWKRQRLHELGLEPPGSLHFVPVDFESGASWQEQLAAAGFDPTRPAVVASTGVSVYLTDDAVHDMLQRVAGLAPGSTLAMSFMVPLDDVDADERTALEGAERGARAGGTPWVSFFTPTQLLALATAAGFAAVHHVSHVELAERYFAGRDDGLHPSSAEQLLVATT